MKREALWQLNTIVTESPIGELTYMKCLLDLSGCGHYINRPTAAAQINACRQIVNVDIV